MKTFVQCGTLFSTLVFLVLLSSCKKDSDDPDYVNDYTPTLTENSGKVYTGDYFPFATGYSWNWSGTATTTGFIEVSAMGESEKNPLDDNSSVSAYMIVKSPISLVLPSGTFTVFPTDEPGDAKRYFIKTDTSLLIKAVQYLNGNPAQVNDPVYIKEPLVVGDKWASTPSVDIKEMLSGTAMNASDINITTKCSLFVLGKESFNWNGQNNETVKLQERAQAKGTMNVNMNGMSGPLNIDVKMDIFLLLLKDVGILRQYGTMEIKISGKVTYNDIPVNINMETTQDQDLVLNTYDVINYKTALPKITPTNTLKSQRVYTKYSDVNKLIQDIVNGINKAN